VVSLSAFAKELPLSYVAYDWRLPDLLQELDEADYSAAVAHVVRAALVLAVLEAWRRRLSRRRQYRVPADARLSLGLAAPLYLVVGLELLLLPIDNGLLDVPGQREYLPVKVTFAKSFSADTDIAGQTLSLVQVRPGPTYAFYCPDGARTWTAEARDVAVVPGSRAPLSRLLKQFQSTRGCRIGSGVPEEVTR
jgi:hypothetical protein